MSELASGQILLNFRKIVMRKCTPAWHMDPSCLDVDNLTLVTGGAAEYCISGQAMSVRPGDMLYVPAGTLRQASTQPPRLMNCYSLDFSITDCLGNRLTLPLPYLTRLDGRNDIQDLCERMNREWLRHLPGCNLKVNGLMMQLLYLVLPFRDQAASQESMDGRIQRMIHHMSENFARDLSLGYYAEQLHLVPTYLGALFKQEVGITFSQYLMDIRLNVAEDLLSTGGYSVNEAAYLSGFQDVSYFSRAFKNSRGIAPGRFAKLMEQHQYEPINGIEVDAQSCGIAAIERSARIRTIMKDD